MSGGQFLIAMLVSNVTTGVVWFLVGRSAGRQSVTR
jgi:hypothetical protein